jgi:hypothetical protein
VKRIALVALLSATTAGCQLLSFGHGTVPLSVSGSGTFDCGSGFHGCTAWLAIRPADWQRPSPWAPGKDDRDFRPTPGESDMSVWLVSGSGLGGPEALHPGDYRFMAVITETDDTTPWVLGTDEHPGTGVLNLTIACEEPISVPEDAAGMAVTVAFGPDCSITTGPSPP